MKHGLMLLSAIVLEVTGTAIMKYLLEAQRAEGYAVMLAFISLSYFCLSKAVKKIPISTAYALWEGFGLIGTAFLAWLIFNETMPAKKILAFAVILTGLAMVKKGTLKGGNTNG